MSVTTTDQPTSGATATPLAGLLAPTQAFLQGLELLPDPGASAAVAPSTDVIKSATMALTSDTQKLIKWGSAGGAGAGLISGIVAAVQGASDSIIVALVIGTSAIISAGVLGLAKVMDGDVRGRSAGTVQELQARATVVQAIMETFDRQSPDADAGSSTSMQAAPTEEQILFALAIFPTKLKVTTAAGAETVRGLRWSQDEGMEVQLLSGDFVATTRISAFST